MREQAREGEGRSNDGGWHLVSRKKYQSQRNLNMMKQGRMDIAGRGWNASDKGKASFYFSEIPNTHGAKEMLRAFAFYGKVAEVVIPPKRNKWGQRFGFARFTDVEDQRLFAVKLDNIIIGAKKIHVNIPRFEREKADAKMENVNRDQYKGHRTQFNYRQEWRKREEAGGREGGVGRPKGTEVINECRGGKVLQEGEATYRRPMKQDQKIVYFRKKNLCDVCYNAPEEELKKLRKMYVAKVRYPGSAHMVQEWFNMQGFFLVKITLLGANLVLLEEWRKE